MRHGVGSHLARMRRVVAADAVDAPHRVLQVAADDRDVGVGHRERRLRALRGCVGQCEPASAPRPSVAVDSISERRFMVSPCAGQNRQGVVNESFIR